VDSLAYIFIFGCCFVGVMIIGVIVAVNYNGRTSQPRVEITIQQLAGQMGLALLDPKRPHRFGGTHQNHPFYLDLGVTGSVSSKSISLGKAIAVSVEVQMREPQKGYAYCNRGHVSPTSSFDSAFSAKLQYEWLSVPAREAMLTFVRRHDDLFLEGLPVNPKADAEDNVRLQHNIPNTTPITPDKVHVVLDELVEVARVIETTC